MLSARGTTSVSLQRRKSGLDFSIKGGKEHGIGVVVSWIKEGGAATKCLHLGDEILAVNGHSLQGLSHAQVVQKLKGAGSHVVLLVRPNPILEDVFTSTSHAPSFGRTAPSFKSNTQETKGFPPSPATPLPEGWTKKLDQRTGRAYYENHYTCVTTWADPRQRQPVPLDKFEWNTLPPGWERFLDPQGDIYYVNHHTQTTHWDCPRGSRQQRLLQQLRDFLKSQREKIKVEEGELDKKRQLVLEKNQQLSILPTLDKSQDLNEEEEEVEESPAQAADLIEDIMVLNEEVDALDGHLNGSRKRLESLTAILQSARAEELGEKDEHQEAAELALALAAELGKIHALVRDLLRQVDSITQLQRSRDPSTTALHHILQLPTLIESKELEERQRWVHVMPDRLTEKTNCELRLELILAQEVVEFGHLLQEKLKILHSHTLSQQGWGALMEELASLDFQPLQEYWMERKHSFRDKLDKPLLF